MKVCLINPPQAELYDPQAYPPLGLLYLAASIKQFNHEVIYFDASLGYAIPPKADVYGVTSTAGTWIAAKNIMNDIKRTYPNAPIVAGGPFPTSMPQYVMDNSLCNTVAIGEAEHTFPDWLHYGYGDGFYNRGDEEIPLPTFVEDLDKLPFPDRDIIPLNVLQHYGGVHGDCYDIRACAATTMITSRGCPFACAFCSKCFSRKVRHRSPHHIAQEMRHIRDTYNIRHLRIVDDLFTLNRHHVFRLCEEIKDDGMYWLSITRADRVDRKLLSAMRKAGCREVSFGIETGSQDLLDKMKKGIKVEQAVKSIQMAKDEGLKVKLFLIFGFPGENRRTIEETKQFLLETKPDNWTVSTFLPLPDSDVWLHPDKYDIEIRTTDFEKYYFYFEPDELKEFVVKYPNEKELVVLRSEFLKWIRKEPWK